MTPPYLEEVTFGSERLYEANHTRVQGVMNQSQRLGG